MGGSRGWYVVSNWFLKQVARVLDSVVGVPQYKHGLLTSMHTFSSTKKTQSSFEEDIMIKKVILFPWIAILINSLLKRGLVNEVQPEGKIGNQILG